eukprot:5797583-Amphidinium_carterae.1
MLIFKQVYKSCNVNPLGTCPQCDRQYLVNRLAARLIAQMLRQRSKHKRAWDWHIACETGCRLYSLPLSTTEELRFMWPA